MSEKDTQQVADEIGPDDVTQPSDPVTPEAEVVEGSVVDDAAATPDPAEPAPETVAHQQALENDLTKALEEAQRNMDGWQRTLAEFQNYKRRVEKDVKESHKRGVEDVIRRILPIIDDFERALASVPAELQGNPWMNGVELILKNFEKLLVEYEIGVIDPVGEEFDPNQHEAIGTDTDTDIESGHVTTTLQKGYISGERILRPALVRIAS